jgi:adenylate cyclase
LISKEEVIAAVWQQPVVTDQSLARCLSEVRAAIGDCEQTIIKTVPRRGYLFTARVTCQQRDELVAQAPPVASVRAVADKPSIAVLAFDNLSGDPEQEYFADGVVEEIITAMSRVRWLFVIARQSSFSYKRRAVDVRTIGRELGVRYVLEGSIRKAGNRVRVTAQLIDATTGAHIWADRYEGTVGDIFSFQDDITLSVVGAIEPRVLLAETERTRSKPTESLDAYDLYLRALSMLRPLQQEKSAMAERLLREAIAIDGNYSDALALLADVLVRRAAHAWVEDWKFAYAEAKDLAVRGVEADPASGVALATAAFTYTVGSHGLQEAKDFADRAISLHPMSAEVRAYCGWTYCHLAECDQAIAHFRLACRLNPVEHSQIIALVGIACAHFFARRFEEAVGAARRALNVSPDDVVASRYLAASLAHLGRLDEARAVATRIVDRQPLASLRRSRGVAFGHPWMGDLFVGGLQIAGIPD